MSTINGLYYNNHSDSSDQSDKPRKSACTAICTLISRNPTCRKIVKTGHSIIYSVFNFFQSPPNKFQYDKRIGAIQPSRPFVKDPLEVKLVTFSKPQKKRPYSPPQRNLSVTFLKGRALAREGGVEEITESMEVSNYAKLI